MCYLCWGVLYLYWFVCLWAGFTQKVVEEFSWNFWDDMPWTGLEFWWFGTCCVGKALSSVLALCTLQILVIVITVLVLNWVAATSWGHWDKNSVYVWNNKRWRALCYSESKTKLLGDVFQIRMWLFLAVLFITIFSSKIRLKVLTGHVVKVICRKW